MRWIIILLPAPKPTNKRGGEWETYPINGQRYFKTKGPGINMHVARIGIQGRFSTNDPLLPNINIGGFFGVNGESVTNKYSQNNNHSGKELPHFEGLDNEFFNQILIGIERKM